MSRRHIALTTLVVRDYAEAIAWYRENLRKKIPLSALVSKSVLAEKESQLWRAHVLWKAQIP